MTKSGKHKKRKKQDFAKVRLKVGKKLSKGDNITKTDFKSRKIVIKDQLQLFSNPSEKKEHSLKECLNQLSHHNKHSRKDALTKLKSIIDNDVTLIERFLEVIIPRLAVIMSDEEYGVRSELCLVLESLLKKVPQERLSVFYPVIFVYLGSALTHINDAIQKSGLDLLALILAFAPPSVIVENQSIFPKVLNLLGCPNLSSVSDDSTLKTASVRTNIGAIEKVVLLQHINKFLNQIEANFESKTIANPEAVMIQEGHFRFSSLISMQQKLINLNYYSTKNQGKYELDYLSFYGLKTLCLQLLPIVISEWCNSKCDLMQKKGVELRLEDLKPHHSLVDIVLSLVNLSTQLKSMEDQENMEAWLHPILATEILPVLFKHFPYTFNQKIFGKKQKALNMTPQEKETGERLLNLKICLLYILTKTTHIDNNGVEIEKYLLESVKDNQHQGQYITKVIDIVKKATMLKSNEVMGQDDKFAKIFTPKLISEILQGYSNLSVNFMMRMAYPIYHLYQLFHKSVDFSSWIESLPKLLLMEMQQNPKAISHIVLELLRSGCRVMDTELIQYYPEILECLIKHKIGDDDARLILSIPYWLPRNKTLTSVLNEWSQSDVPLLHKNIISVIEVS